jgi:hypothetical protein
MAYFNHAFTKVFLGTGQTLEDVQLKNGLVTTDEGFLTTTGLPSFILNQMREYATAQYGDYRNGYFGIFDPKTNLSITPSSCCNVYIAGSSIYTNDKIGPFHGGYQETNKSKMINPRYVSRFYRVDACEPSNNVIHIGNTPYTTDQVTELAITVTGVGLVDGVYTDIPLVDTTAPTGSGLIATITVTNDEVTFVQITNGGTGFVTGDVVTTSAELIPYIDPAEITNAQPTFTVTAGIGANCCKEFLCGETYNLRLDVKGSPALRFLNHNAYLTVSAYTGCCSDNDNNPSNAIVPLPVDSTKVMILWAQQIIDSPLISPFISPVVIAEDGTVYYAPNSLDVFGQPNTNTWDRYVSTGHIDGACAGLILYGAYVDTRFGDCTFQVSDFYEKEPVRLYASETDLNGDPCTFDGICVVTECEPTQGNGFGETVLRDLILSEKYRQNFFSSDFRIREITQGNQIVNVIDRTALYAKYYLLHNVPRFNNPSSTFDNDQYMLEFIVNGDNISFEDTINEWLEGCSNECTFETYGCETDCFPVVTNPYNPD